MTVVLPIGSMKPIWEILIRLKNSLWPNLSFFFIWLQNIWWYFLQLVEVALNIIKDRTTLMHKWHLHWLRYRISIWVQYHKTSEANHIVKAVRSWITILELHWSANWLYNDFGVKIYDHRNLIRLATNATSVRSTPRACGNFK